MQLRQVCYLNPLIISDEAEHAENDIPPFEELLTEDLWSFHFFWREIAQKYSTVENLYAAIQDLYDEIRETKERFRPHAEYFFDIQIESNHNRGVSGSYFIVNEKAERLYILKPLDEDAGCIHSDGYATPFMMSPLRANMPLYKSSMREVLASLVAEIIGIGSIVPKTRFAIVESEQFYDFSQGISRSEIDRFTSYCNTSDKEKLCSMQEYVQNAKTLFEAIHDLEMSGLSNEEIAGRFDQTDFEDANILLWSTYDTDGHMGNFLVYPKTTDEIGNEILGLKKIDNGLAFPDKNQQFRNNLAYLPNADKELSEESKAKIRQINIEAVCKQFEELELDGASFAFRQRITYLQDLIEQPGLTIKEINRSMTNIGKKR